jgi:hypothetical protein
MRKNGAKIIAVAFALQIVLSGAGRRAVAQAGNYPAMAPLDQYLILPDLERSLLSPIRFASDLLLGIPRFLAVSR